MFPLHLIHEVDGHPVEIVVQEYADGILVLVTQVGKIGSFIQASIPKTTPFPDPSRLDPSDSPPLPPPPPGIRLTPLFGSAPSEDIRTLHSLYASQIATIVWSAEAAGHLAPLRRKVLVGIALKKVADAGESVPSPGERRVFMGVMTTLQDALQTQ
jgi:proteasome assembly chaperone 3